MDVVLDLIKNFGLPTTLLLLVGWHHIRSMNLKDEEIKRVNEARISEQKLSAERMMQIAQEFTQLSGEQEKTLALLAERLAR